MQECEASLRRLGVDYIDLYQMHRPDIHTDIDEASGNVSTLSPAARGNGLQRPRRHSGRRYGRASAWCCTAWLRWPSGEDCRGEGSAGARS